MVNESRSNGRRIDNNSPFFAVPNGATTCDWPDLTTRRMLARLLFILCIRTSLSIFCPALNPLQHLFYP